jgi:hypothetical protein
VSEVREGIVRTFAAWTALSALRSGAPIKSREDVYRLIRRGYFKQIADTTLGPLSALEFDAWHEHTCAAMLAEEARLQVGWTATILNVYLKTYAYVGGLGRSGLVDVIHPPIDTGLWLGLARRFVDRPDILDHTNCVKRIKHINDYACYRRIIDGCRLAAAALGCRLVEVEQLWATTERDEVSA